MSLPERYDCAAGSGVGSSVSGAWNRVHAAGRSRTARQHAAPPEACMTSALRAEPICAPSAGRMRAARRIAAARCARRRCGFRSSAPPALPARSRVAPACQQRRPARGTSLRSRERRRAWRRTWEALRTRMRRGASGRRAVRNSKASPRPRGAAQVARSPGARAAAHAPGTQVEKVGGSGSIVAGPVLLQCMPRQRRQLPPSV